MMSTLDKGSNRSVSVFKQKQYYSLDYASKYFEVHQLHNLSSTKVISKMKSKISKFRIPSEVAGDNGPQYMSRKFQGLTITSNFKYRKSSPANLESNGPVKRTIQTIKVKSTIIGSIPSFIGIKNNI